jgi:aldehyde:ferredoxin oxidoreductase
MALVGGSCGINNPAAIIKINALCNDLGMDTMDIGDIFACAMEMYEKEIISQEDLGLRYLTLRFGDAEAMLRLIEDTAYRKGFGNILAEGGYHLAERYGHPELFMGVKKMGLPAYDPRNAHGMGLEIATSTRGACHNRAYTIAPEILGAPYKVDPLTEEGKGALVKEMQDLTASLMDAAGICLFSIVGNHTPEQMFGQLDTVTGVGYTFPECLKNGERIWNVQKLFNLKAGLTAADDTLPKRFLEEPAPGGPGKGLVVDLDKMLKDYYELRGWDKNGVPTPAKLAELGLK